MATVEQLLAMVRTEALEGGTRNHYFDESRAPEREHPPRLPIPMQPRPKCDEHEPLSFIYHLELIEYPDGSLEWIE